MRARGAGDDLCERRLAGARRPPEDDRLEHVGVHRFAQRTPWREQRLLADDLVERARTHALGQRRRDVSLAFAATPAIDLVEQSHQVRAPSPR